jgi:hypothetical protein
VNDKLKGIVHNFVKIMIHKNGDRNTNMKRRDIICGVLNDGLRLSG